jgi:hypothetical protein
MLGREPDEPFGDRKDQVSTLVRKRQFNNAVPVPTPRDENHRRLARFPPGVPVTASLRLNVFSPLGKAG